MDEFEEEVNGVNLGKLFSVYGPSSQHLARQKHVRNQKGKLRNNSGNRTGSHGATGAQSPHENSSIMPSQRVKLPVAMQGDVSLSKSFDMMPTLKRLVPHGNVIVNANNNPI